MKAFNIPIRGRKVNKIGIGIIAAVVIFAILAWFYLAISRVYSKKSEDEIAVAHKAMNDNGKMFSDRHRAPEDLPYDEKKDEKQAEKKVDVPVSVPSVPVMSIREVEERHAAKKAWANYYDAQLAKEQHRIESMRAGMESPWKDGSGSVGEPSPSGQPLAVTSAPIPGVPDYVAASLADTGSGSGVESGGQWTGADERKRFAGQGDSGLPFMTSARTGMLAPYAVMASDSISAITVGGMTSEAHMPVVRSLVTSNVFCAVPGGRSNEVCIPAGSRLLLSYNARVSQGECRLQVLAERLQFPDNSEMSLEKAPVADVGGYGGLKDRCDSHLLARLMNATLFTAVDGAFGLGQAALGAREVNVAPVESIARQEARVGTTVPPTLEIRPNVPFKVVLHKTVYFDAPYKPMTSVAGN